MRPAPTPAMTPVVLRSASSSRAVAVTGKPVRASWVAPVMPMPASSMTIPAETTREGVHVQSGRGRDHGYEGGHEAPGRLLVEKRDALEG